MPTTSRRREIEFLRRHRRSCVLLCLGSGTLALNPISLPGADRAPRDGPGSPGAPRSAGAPRKVPEPPATAASPDESRHRIQGPRRRSATSSALHSRSTRPSGRGRRESRRGSDVKRRSEELPRHGHFIRRIPEAMRTTGGYVNLLALGQLSLLAIDLEDKRAGEHHCATGLAWVNVERLMHIRWGMVALDPEDLLAKLNEAHPLAGEGVDDLLTLVRHRARVVLVTTTAPDEGQSPRRAPISGGYRAGRVFSSPERRRAQRTAAAQASACRLSAPPMRAPDRSRRVPRRRCRAHPPARWRLGRTPPRCPASAA